jgi:hypothetical protein
MEGGNKMKMTEPQARLYKKLPEMFTIFEDFDKENCPPTIIRNEKGIDIYQFGKGDHRAFCSLVRNGHIENGGSMGKWETLYSKKNN